MACYIPRWYTRPKTVTHPGTNRARRALTWFMRRTPLTTAPRVDRVAYHVICASGTACTMHCSRTVSPTITAVSLVSSPEPSGPYCPESSAVGSLNLGGTAANTRRHELTRQIHTHTFNGPLSGTTRVSRYQRGKTNLDFTEARDSEWQWHQLGYYASLHLAPDR